jgi:beta-glucosidase-like glycosyl hydrolase/CubicO group peptidase (beta-lactamase class C family)
MFLRKYLIILSIFFTGCAGPINLSSKNDWAVKTLDKLTLREKIAQMMVVSINLNFFNLESKQWIDLQNYIKSDGIGVLHIWFGDVGTSLILLNEMQKNSKVPILIDADIESGLGRRFDGAVTLPPMMAIAATGDASYAYEAGRISAEESRAVGIHFNLSPVVDVNNNPKNPIINTRSFGENPDSVSRYSIEYIKGLQNNGMLATAKHFPGHGDTETDSHSSLAQIPSDSTRLWNVELKPFKKVIDAGVDAVMVAHVNAPDFQDHAENPATLSKFWIQDILKTKLGFDGVVITDAMRMGGIVKNYSDKYALFETINAGSDIIIQNMDLKRSIDHIEKAVLSGIISENRINRSALKVLKMKEKLGLHNNRMISMKDTYTQIGKQKNFKSAAEIAQKSITLVVDKNKLLPLQPEVDEVLYIIDLYDRENNHAESDLTKQLKRAGRKVISFQIDKSDSLLVADYILDQIPKDALVLLNAFANPVEHKDEIFLPKVEAIFINKLIKKSKKMVVTSFGSPYLIQDFKDVPVYICAYKGSPLLQKAVGNALIGNSNISGILPITIPGIAKVGEGLKVIRKKWPKRDSNWKSGKELKRIRADEISVNISNIQKYLSIAVKDSAFPGGVLLASKDGEIFIHEAFGYHTYAKKERVTRGDIYDLASITKVIATTSSVMLLVDQNKISLDDKVVKYLPEFKGLQKNHFKQKSNTTIRHLITHTAGLPAFKEYFKMNKPVEVILDSVMNTEPKYELEKNTIYSDVGIITLGKVVETISDTRLDLFTDSLIFNPLGMNSTYFNPPKSRIKRIVPTELSKVHNKTIHGFVHDENAHSLNGVAGHAGLFSTARDLATFSQMMLNNGIYGWKRIFNSETVNLFTSRANLLEGSSRALGWDTPKGKASGGVYLSDSSYGHTGFTGTSLWIDPEHQVFIILLTNAVHPSRSYKDPSYYNYRQKIHSDVYEALGLTNANPNLLWRKKWD